MNSHELLNKSVLSDDDFKYIENYEKFYQQFLRHEASIRREALAEGIQQGIALGEEKGIEKGIALGEEKAKTDMVKSLLQGTNFDISYIVKLANVAESFVEKVKQDLEN